MPHQLLFADDSATMHRVMQITFAREDFVVTAVDSGAAAIDRARTLQPNVIVIDVGMPGMDGYTVCQSLKSDPATAHIPVMLLASAQLPIDERRLLACRANGHAAKPFEIQTFIERVHQLVGVQAAAKTSVAASTTPHPAPLPKPLTSEVTVPTAAPQVNTPTFTTPAPSPKPFSPLPTFSTAPTSVAPVASGWSMPSAGAAPPRMPTPLPAPTPTPSFMPTSAPMAAATPAAPSRAAELQVRSTVAPNTGPASAPVTVSPLAARAPVVPPLAAPTTPVVAGSPAPAALSSVMAAVTQQVASSASGISGGLGIDPQTLQAMAREILERIAWEVVPPLAEALIRENIGKNQGR